MEIKGVDNLKNKPNVQGSPTQNSLKNVAASKESAPKNVETNYTESNLRIKQLMQEIKGLENRVSQQQFYLEQLMKAQKELVSNKTVPQITAELMRIKEQARFNQKPMMNAIIPSQEQIQAKGINIEEMEKKVSLEIEKIKGIIKDAQKEVSRFSISIENMQASTSRVNIKEMQPLFKKEMLYKNFNKDLVVSLMA